MPLCVNYLDKYRDHLGHQALAEVTVKQMLVIIRRYFGEVNPAQISQDQLHTLLTDQGKTWSLSYLRKVRRALASYFEFCYSAGIITFNPMRDVPAVSAIRGSALTTKIVPSIVTHYSHYLENRDRSDATIEQRVGDIVRLSRSLPLLEVTQADLGGYLRQQNGWSQEYRRKIRASFVSFYSWLFETGQISCNPSTELRAIRPGLSTRDPIPEALLLVAFYGAGLRDQAIIALAGSLGLRRSEIARLHTRDRKGWQLAVHGKGDQIRVLPLNALTHELLVELEREHGRGYYFPGRNPWRQVHPSTIYKRIKPLIGDYTLHSLRHRAAQKALASTGGLRGVQVFLGHANSSTTEVYTKVYDTNLQAVSYSTQWPRNQQLLGRNASTAQLTIDLNALTEDQVVQLTGALLQHLQKQLVGV